MFIVVRAVEIELAVFGVCGSAGAHTYRQRNRKCEMTGQTSLFGVGDWGLLIYIGRWRVPEANSKKLEEMFRAICTHLRSNRERYPQLRSGVICSSAQGGSSEENWLWVEEYADREAYDAFYKALEEDKTFLEIHDKQYDFWRLIVEGSFKGELYTERARF